MQPKNLEIEDYTYNLPEDRIAKYPLEERDQSKLLVFENDEITSSTFNQIDRFLPPDSLLVFNDTRVINARLLFKKETGGAVEIFCLEPDERYPNILFGMEQKGRVLWKCLVGGASKWKHGVKLQKSLGQNGEVILTAGIAEKLPDAFVIEFTWQPASLRFAELLNMAGFIPLPPYLHREVEDADTTRYQTIYSNTEGSVAAPTAGLHFTPSVFQKLDQKNITKEFVTLHVGAGTFKPVKAKVMEEHEMHAEFIEISVETIETLLRFQHKAIIAVGTTSLRVIESMYWMGLKVMHNPSITISEIPVSQWLPYELMPGDISPKEVLYSLRDWMQKKGLKKMVTKTQILIAPGYDLNIATGLITNFHQPHSTLLLLVAAVVGNSWRSIYNYAMDNNFRFLSFGDCSLLWRKKRDVQISSFQPGAHNK